MTEAHKEIVKARIRTCNEGIKRCEDTAREHDRLAEGDDAGLPRAYHASMAESWREKARVWRNLRSQWVRGLRQG